MSSKRYTAEFKAEAVKQITERGYGVVEVSKRLGISDKSLYVWLKQSPQHSGSNAKEDVVALKKELVRMKAEFQRHREELERRVEERTAELAARERELQLRNCALDQSFDATYLVDAGLRFRYVNKAAVRALGYSREELMSLTLLDIDPNITREMVHGLMQQTAAAGRFPGTVESRHRRKNGETFPIEVGATTFTYEGETLFLTVVRDITERKRAEQALAAKEREFRALAENAPDNIARHDRQCRFVYVNPQFEAMMGMRVQEIAGMTPVETYPGNPQVAAYQARMAAVIETGQPDEVEAVLPDIGEGPRYHNIRLVAEYGADGNITGALAIGRDVSAHRRTELELAAREREFRSLAESSPDNVVRWDTEGRYVYINPAHERTLGKSLAEVAGTFIPDSRPIKKAFTEVVATRKPAYFARLPVKAISDNGEELHGVSLVPEFDEHGRLVSVLGIGRDMTDIYRMQDDIARREQEFRSLAESSPDALARFDKERRIRYLNAKLLQVFGLSSVDEAVGKKYIEIWPDGRHSVTERVIERVIASGQAESVEIEWPNASGELRSRYIHVIPERDGNGNVIGALAFGRDVTDIRKNERKLKSFIENLPGFAFIFSISPEGQGSFPYASHGIQALYGLMPEDVKNDMAPLHNLAHPDDRRRIEESIAEAARTLELFRIEFRVCRAGMPDKWLEARSVPERQPDGSVLWYGIMLDITSRKHAELEMIRREMEFRSLAENIPDTIIRYDAHGRKTYVNTAVVRFIGMEAGACSEQRRKKPCRRMRRNMPPPMSAVFTGPWKTGSRRKRKCSCCMRNWESGC